MEFAKKAMAKHCHFLSLLSSLCISSCTHTPKISASTSVPRSEPTFRSESIANNTDAPRALTPSSNSNNSFHLPASSGNDAAIVALVFLGLTVAFSNNPQSEDLQGTCLYGDPNNLAFTSPCIHEKIKLVDDKNAVQATTETNENGNFRFYIPKGFFYFIQVADRKGRRSQLNKKIGRGNNVSVFLIP